jgi:hypothetical protein
MEQICCQISVITESRPLGSVGAECHAKLLHLSAAFAGTRVTALRWVTRLHTATHVHC